MDHAKPGYAYFRVMTPQVAAEYELPLEGTLKGADRKNYERLQDLAEIHRTSIHTSPYQTL